jgi:hypothetical protein
MNIGIDFDNTIAWYDSSFRDVALSEGFINESWAGSEKTDIRDYLRSQPAGEKTWMRLQGLVYGKFMHHAEMMPGVANFLIRCRARKHRVYIISHKTEYGHFDPDKVSLRQQALKWMQEKRFFDPSYFDIQKQDVFFCDTRQAKVERIIQKRCDCFIDDLPEVFAEDIFPDDIQKILFGYNGNPKESNVAIPKLSWEEVSELLLGPTTDEDVGTWADLLVPFSFNKINRISGRGNSRIFKLTAADKRQYALKSYPDKLADKRTRLITEYNAVCFLKSHGFENIPEAAEKNDDLNIGLFSWIDGSSIMKPGNRDLDQVISFVQKLAGISKPPMYPLDRWATGACLSALELTDQIDSRLERLKSVASSFPALQTFLNQSFTTLWQDLKHPLVNMWPERSRDKNLDENLRVLSPSDFGFHNALKNSDRITFIDFEYFGWDDPVKLTADFLWHPGMELDPHMAAKWENAMIDLFSGDPDFVDRLQAAMPLYGLRWTLILLNEFLPGFAERRRYAVQNNSNHSITDDEKSRSDQLAKAKQFCERVKNCILELGINPASESS